MFTIRSSTVRKKLWESTTLRSLLYPLGFAGLTFHPPCHTATPVGQRPSDRLRRRRKRKSGMQARMELANFETTETLSRPG